MRVFWFFGQGNRSPRLECKAWVETLHWRLSICSGWARIMGSNQIMVFRLCWHCVPRWFRGCWWCWASELVEWDPNGWTWWQERWTWMARTQFQAKPGPNLDHNCVGGFLPSCSREFWTIWICRVHAKPSNNHPQTYPRGRHPWLASTTRWSCEILLVQYLKPNTGNSGYGNDRNLVNTFSRWRVLGPTLITKLDKWSQGKKKLIVVHAVLSI